MRRLVLPVLGALAVACLATAGTPAVESCRAQDGLPDATCTPGAVDPARTQALVCTTSTRTVRPPLSVTGPIKDERMAAYGYTDSPRGYELDHLISLELGGAPADTRNLWPESYTGPWNAHVKDRLENELHRLVCSGAMDLPAAQQCIAHDWVQCYEEVVSR